MSEPKDRHSDTEAIVAALLASGEIKRQVKSSDEEALARFACGWASPSESRSMIRALTRSVSLRNRLLVLRREISLANESAQARESLVTSDPLLAKVIGAAMRSSLEAYMHWDETCRKAANSSAKELRTVHAFIADLVGRLATTQRGPALARGSRHEDLVRIQPGTDLAELTISCDSGKVSASARFEKPFDVPTEVSLYLADGEGSWVWIGSSMSEGSSWHFEASNWCQVLNLPSQALGSQWFALSIGRLQASPKSIPVQVAKDLQKKGAPTHLHLGISTPPVVRSEQFDIGIDFPSTMRRSYSSARLCLSLDVGKIAYVLGSWNVGELPEGSVTLTAPVPGTKDGAIDFLGGIKLSLRS